MKQYISMIVLSFLIVCMPLLTGCTQEKSVTNHVHADVSIEAEAGALDAVAVTLPEGMTRETVSAVQHDFIQDGQQVGGIVVVDIPSEVLDSPMKGVLEITELLRQQLMPDVPVEEAQMISCGGNQNAYMELATGPDDFRYFHFLFRGVTNTYDVWFHWELLDQNAELIYEIVNSVTAEDILPENNQSPF